MSCVIEEFNLCISMIMWHIRAQLQGSVSQHRIAFLSLKENLLSEFTDFCCWCYKVLTLQTVPLEGGVGFIYLFKLRQLLEEYNFLKKPVSI